LFLILTVAFGEHFFSHAVAVFFFRVIHGLIYVIAGHFFLSNSLNRDGDYANTPSVDLEEALFWLNKAAKQGYWDAKGILNELYEEGFIQKSGDSFIVVSN
jgi:hypothetical protein